MSRSASQAPSPTASGERSFDPEANPVAVTGGEIYWHGVYRPRASAIRLRDEFAIQATAGDWFAPTAQQYADALTNALRMTEREDA